MGLQTAYWNPAPVSATTATGNSPLSGLPDIPPPWQLAPTLFASPPAPLIAAAQSVPIASRKLAEHLPDLPPVSDIPPPHLAAPWVYLRMPAAIAPAPAPIPMPWPVQAPPGPPLMQFFNQTWAPPVPMQPAFMPSAGYPAMPQAFPMQPPMPPPQPPMPPQPPPPAQPPPAPPPPPPAQPKGPTGALDPSALNDEVIRSLNRRLNDPNEDVRADAAVDFYRIIERNQELADNPVYKPYVDAFLEKILKDPSTTVRGGGLLCLQMGRVRNPSKGVKNQLKIISQRVGITSEDRLASNILGELASNTLRVPKALPPPPPNPLAKAMSSGPASAPAPASVTAPAPAPAPSPVNLKTPMPQYPPGMPPGLPATTVQASRTGNAPYPAQPGSAALYPIRMSGNRVNQISSPQSFADNAPENSSIGQKLNIQEGFTP